ncbi:hypothetical protein [Streptomyces sp. NPDC058382]|uniref:hypothetical protein n=1 Tax=unclassified Streptomyces TaxID=2593676 RepID=UPI003632DDC8
MRKPGRMRRRASGASAPGPDRTSGRAAPAGLLLAALLPAALPSPAYAGQGPPLPNPLYRYGYSLGFHPFTSPHAVRAQLTDNFWLFPVRGDCPSRIRLRDVCELLGGNPVRVEAVGQDSLQIATLPGHDLGEGLHIRFLFTRSLGLHCLVVSAWQNRPTACTERTLCRAASRAGARALWRVLSETLTMSAYIA